VAFFVAVPLYIRLYSVLFVYSFPRKIINLLILKALKMDLKSLAFRGVPVQVWPRAPFYGRENNSKKQSRERLFLCLKFVTVLIVVKKFLKKDRTLSFY